MDYLSTIDYTILKFINENCVSDILTKIFQILQYTVNHGEIWILTALLMIFIKQRSFSTTDGSHTFKKYRTYGIILFITLAFTFAMTELVLKHIVLRPRPFVQYPEFIPLITAPSGTSFPSSHTATCFASAFVLFRCNKKLGIPAYIFAFIIAFSRIYFLVHFPSDVLAGMLIGTLCGELVYFIIKQIYKKRGIRI